MSPCRLAALLVCITAPILSAPAAAESWIVRADLWGNPAFSTLTVDRAGTASRGGLDGDRIAGTAARGRMTLTATDVQGRVSIYTLHMRGSELNGAADMPDPQ